jgi:probable HAF family extracellular repeat protein
MVRTWWHKLFSQGQSGVQRGHRWARVRQRRRQKPLLESLEERCLLSYQVTDLGHGGADGINDSGQVIGDKGIWDSTHGWQSVGFYPTGINNSGQVVGFSGDDVGNVEAFLWDAVHGTQDLGRLPGFDDSQATGINNSGQAVGRSGPHAFLWDAANGMQDVGTLPGGRAGWAYGINDSGQVVGESYTASGPLHAFLWDAVQGMQDLGTLPGHIASLADGINNNGQVVGGSWFSGDDRHAFLWDAINGMQDLGTLSGAKPSVALGINNNGQVVGGSYTASDQAHAFLWQNGTMSDLNDLIPPDSGWVAGLAFAINNAGQIVGQGVHNGQSNAFLLTPDSSPRTAPAGTVHFTRSDAQAALLFGMRNTECGMRNTECGMKNPLGLRSALCIPNSALTGPRSPWPATPRRQRGARR